MGSESLGGYTVEDGALYNYGRIYVLDNLVTDVLQEIYAQLSSAYPGIRRTIGLVRRYYYIPRLRAIVERYIRNY